MQTALDSIGEAISISQVLIGAMKTTESVFSPPFLTKVVDLTSTYSLLLAKTICAHPEILKRVSTADIPLLNKGARTWVTEALCEDNANSLEAIFDTAARTNGPDGRMCSIVGVLNILKEAQIVPDLVDMGVVTFAFQNMSGAARRIDSHQFLLLLHEVTGHNEALLCKVICQLLAHYGYEVVDRCAKPSDVIYTIGEEGQALEVSGSMTRSELIDAKVAAIIENERVENKLSQKLERLLETKLCNSQSGIIADLFSASHYKRHLSTSTKQNTKQPGKSERQRAQPCSEVGGNATATTVPIGTIRSHTSQGKAAHARSTIATATTTKQNSRPRTSLEEDIVSVYSKLFYAKYIDLLIKRLNTAVIMPGSHPYKLKHKLEFFYDSIKQFYGTEQYVSFNNALSFLLLHMKNSGLGRQYLAIIVKKSLDVKIGEQHVMSKMGFAEMLFIAALSVYDNDENGDCDMMSIEEKVMRIITVLLENK